MAENLCKLCGKGLDQHGLNHTCGMFLSSQPGPHDELNRQNRIMRSALESIRGVGGDIGQVAYDALLECDSPEIFAKA